MTDLVSDALDLDPWGVCAPSGSLDVPQMIPPTESVAIGLKTIASPNVELGRKDFPGFALMLRLQPQTSFQKSCTLNGWMMRSEGFHRQNLMESGSIYKRPGWISTGLEGNYNLSSNLVQLHKPSICLAPSLAELCNTANWILLNSTVKYLDGISDGIGCVSQHRNLSMVVVSFRNPQNSRSRLSSSFGNSRHQIITIHNEELGQIHPFILFPI
jgi:hypothetical protein